MPHKKAKRSVRERNSQTRGHDLAPGAQSPTSETLPKSLMRVLNASKIRSEYNNKRKYSEQSEPKGNETVKRRKPETNELRIQPGESIQHFNKRVENDMRPLVKAAVQSSNATLRNALKGSRRPLPTLSKRPVDEAHSDLDPDEGPISRLRPSTSDRPKEFQPLSTSQPKRLNDIAQAPPELKSLPRGAGKKDGSLRSESTKAANVLSMAQKAMMEEERERVIKRYREMKAARNQAA